MDALRSPPELPGGSEAMVPAPFELLGRRRDTADTWTLELRPPDGEPLAFAPGQFTMLAAGGCGEVPISISGDPDRPGRLVQTVRRVGAATAAICAAEPGQTLAVRGPFGTCWPVEEAEGSDVVIAAGGLGLPPLRPAILRMLSRRERYGRLVLLYGGRSPDQLMFGDELSAWSQQGLEVLVTVDSAGPEWLGHVGVVTRLVRWAGLNPARTIALTCGPEVMMRFLAAALAAEGVPDERMYVSLERNMQCGIGHCGHCQLGPVLLCRDGPVLRLDRVAPWLAVREL
jgi:NAD(P)H-flavin reductase